MNETEEAETKKEEDTVSEPQQEDHVDHSSKSDVEIVLSVIGRLCDGQNTIMQVCANNIISYSGFVGKTLVLEQETWIRDQVQIDT